MKVIESAGQRCRIAARRAAGTIARLLAAVSAAVMLTVAMPTAGAETQADRAALEAELRATESAFAATMAARDVAAFAAFIADDAVFFGATALRGRAAIVERWSRFFEGPDAPFSWAPEQVVVLDSQPLGLSTGPVRDPAGVIVGTFTSIWRREAAGWRIVFDKGCDACPSPAPASDG